MIADPTGILSRVPELEPLTEEPGVRRAIERGDLHRLYRILFWANIFGRMRAHRETIRLLLARRRLFLTPLRSAPGLFTVNGVGLTAYGNDDADPNDGSFILTHYLCFLFVPLFPVRQYLVRRADGGVRRAWTFFGKVPLGPFTFFWNRLVSTLVVAGVAFGLYSAWHSSRFHEVHLVNGTGLPVKVAIGDRRAELGPEDHKTVTVRVGRQHVEIKSPTGSVIESTDIDVAVRASVLAVNVLGAAPLFSSEVRYGREGTPNDGIEPHFELACGKTTIRFDGIDYAFVDPPKTISLPEHSSGASRRHVAVFPGGLQSCVNYLANKDQIRPAAALAKRVAEATGFAVPLATNMAVSLLEQSENLAASYAFLEQARAAHPEDLATQRLFQHVAAAAGKRDQLVTLYRKRLDEAPNDPDRAYLLARLQSPAAGQPVFADLVRRFPQHLWIRRAHAYSEFQLRHFDAALQSWQQLRKQSPEEWPEVLPLVARAMVAAGRGREALQEIEASFAAAHPQAVAAAALYAQVARTVGANGELLFGRLRPDNSNTELNWRRAVVGLPVDETASNGLPTHLRESLAIVRAASTDPGEALRLTANASPKALRSLDEETWMLVYAEAARRREEPVMLALAPPGSMKDELARAVRDFIASGRLDAALEEGPFEWRAAVELIRSRVTKVTPAERSRLLAAARQDDLLHGQVTNAIDGWKQH